MGFTTPPPKKELGNMVKLTPANLDPQRIVHQGSVAHSNLALVLKVNINE